SLSDLGVDGGLVLGGGVVALADGVEEGLGRLQVQAGGLGDPDDAALRGPDRRAGVLLLDLGDEVLVALQAAVLVLLALDVEIGGVGGVEALVVSGYLADDALDVG